MFVDPIEALWFLVNAIGCVVTVIALLDALADRSALLTHNGRTRLLVVSGNIRREVIRLLVQAVLLTVVIPGLFVDRPIPLNPIVVLLISVPVLLTVSSLFDARERRTLARYIREDAEALLGTRIDVLEAAAVLEAGKDDKPDVMVVAFEEPQDVVVVQKAKGTS